MDKDDAIRIAGLWRAGKLIGGNAHAVSVALLDELEKERRRSAAAVAQERERCAKLCEEDSFEVGAALAAEIRRSQ